MPRGLKLAAWVGAWAGVVALAQVLPLWASIGLAGALFAVQVLAAPLGTACHLPDDVTKRTPGRPG